MYRILLLILFFQAYLPLSAQYRTRKEPDKQLAKDNFSAGNFTAAITEYKLLNQSNADHPLYNYRLGVSYLMVNGDRTLAIPHLEFAARTEDFKSKAHYDLALAYMYAGDYNKAEEAWKTHLSLNPNLTSAEKDYINRQVETCYNARELKKYPLSVSFQNLGKEINSPYPDYYPFIKEDESELVFTSRRKGTLGGYQTFDGFYTSDIFMSNEKAGSWSKARGAGSQVNTSGDDEAVSYSASGEHLYIYSENEFDYGDVIYAEKKNRGFAPRSVVEDPVNSADIEVAAAISYDGDVLVFSSDRAGGKGELDLYMARKLPNGKWGTPVNLGDQVNSPYNEDFPYFSPDGKWLYFASQGHVGMGGFDVFRSAFNAETGTFGPAANIGYPLNNAWDNMTISFSSSNRYAYLSTWRPDSYGDLDIYRVTFEEQERELTALRGSVMVEKPIDYNSSKKVSYFSKGGVKKAFPHGFVPPADWKPEGDGVISVKEGTEHLFVLDFEKGGVPVSFPESALPEDLSGHEFKNIRFFEKPVKGFTPPSPNRPVIKNEPVKTAMLSLFNKSDGELYGTYQTIGESGRYVIIAPPGEYEIEIEAPGLPVVKESVRVLDKGSYQLEVEKDIILKTPAK